MSELERTRQALSACGRALGRDAAAEIGRRYARADLDDEEGLTAGLCSLLASEAFQRASGLAAPHAFSVAVLHKVREEPSIGADLMITFRSALPEWTLATRSLLQAKRVEPGQRMVKAEWARMQRQAATMLSAVHESFVLGYARRYDHALCVFPALSVAGCASQEIFDLDNYRFAGFLEGIFCGFIGQSAVGDPPPGRSWAKHEIEILIEKKRAGEQTFGATGSGPQAPDGLMRTLDAAGRERAGADTTGGAGR